MFSEVIINVTTSEKKCIGKKEVTIGYRCLKFVMQVKRTKVGEAYELQTDTDKLLFRAIQVPLFYHFRNGKTYSSIYIFLNTTFRWKKNVVYGNCSISIHKETVMFFSISSRLNRTRWNYVLRWKNWGKNIYRLNFSFDLVLNQQPELNQKPILYKFASFIY